MNRSRGALLMAALAFASTQPSPAQDMAIKPKTAAEAKAFTDKVEKELLQLANAASRADWVKSTHITDDTEAIAAEANQHYTEAAVAAAKRAATFDSVKVAPDVARKLKLLKVALVTPAPTGSAESKEVATLAARLEGTYGKGKYTRKNKDGKEETLDLGELSNILVTSRDPREMEEAWAGWHSIARPMKNDFIRFVELQNKATKEVSAEVKAGEDTQLTIAMDVANTPPAGFVDGAFVDDAGAPVAITLAVTGMGIDEPFKSNEAGLIRLELPAGEYGAIARAEGFEDKVLRFTVAAGDQAVVVKETLTRSVPPSTPNVIGKGKSLRLKKSIKYDGNNPNEKTLPILDELAAYLRVHPEYETVEIGVHSDDRGNPKTKTSERADNVRNYLLSKGVSPDRVTAVGFGASRPVAVNMTASGRAKNNRTVLRVTKYTKPTAAAPAAAPAPGK